MPQDCTAVAMLACPHHPAARIISIAGGRLRRAGERMPRRGLIADRTMVVLLETRRVLVLVLRGRVMKPPLVLLEHAGVQVLLLPVVLSIRLRAMMERARLLERRSQARSACPWRVRLGQLSLLPSSSALTFIQ